MIRRKLNTVFKSCTNFVFHLLPYIFECKQETQSRAAFKGKIPKLCNYYLVLKSVRGICLCLWLRNNIFYVIQLFKMPFKQINVMVHTICFKTRHLAKILLCFFNYTKTHWYNVHRCRVKGYQMPGSRTLTLILIVIIGNPMSYLTYPRVVTP